MNYQNGKIYTIRSNQTDKFYIGSTCSPLYKRFYQHKNAKSSELRTGNGYTKSFEILQFDDAYIELLEDYPCENKQQLERREGELIRKNKDICVNFIVPKRTRKEYRSDNKEKINNQKKQSYIRNKDKILAQQKEFRDLNKDEINAKRRNNIARKIRINELRRKKYAENKEEILKKRKETMKIYICECGNQVPTIRKKRHEKTQKHQNYKNSITKISKEIFNTLFKFDSLMLLPRTYPKYEII